jgi:galactose-1-phosphate uridylyltransferase
MIAEIMKKHPRVKDLKKANAILTEYVNNVCKNILFNTSVFKKDSVGVAAFNKFLDSCGLNLVK